MATFSDLEFWLASGNPTVFRDATGIWRCLYQGKPCAEPQEPCYPLLLESDDGLRWQAPDLTRAVPLDERRFRNQVMPVTRFREWDCYFDTRARVDRDGGRQPAPPQEVDSPMTPPFVIVGASASDSAEESYSHAIYRISRFWTHRTRRT